MMIKKFLILSLMGIFLSACGYSSLYKGISEKKLNLSIVEINGDKELNNFILSKLNKYLNKKKGEQIKIIINTIYTKSVVSRDSKGSISNYQLVADATFNVEVNDQKRNIKMKENFIMKNINDSYERKNYERTIKQNLSNSIANELILRLSTIK
tara:strand:+ start:345 stop:806 length:462 start_codon:yes stop_codon:yes gene_type:complete